MTSVPSSCNCRPPAPRSRARGERPSFRVNFTSQKYVYDGTTTASGGVCGTVTGTKNGVVDWQEVDGDSPMLYGNCNATLDAGLTVVDSVLINLKVLYGAKQQEYQTQVDLRNANA